MAGTQKRKVESLTMLNDCSRSETKRERERGRVGEKERESGGSGETVRRQWEKGRECCKLSQTMPYADATHKQGSARRCKQVRQTMCVRVRQHALKQKAVSARFAATTAAKGNLQRKLFKYFGFWSNLIKARERQKGGRNRSRREGGEQRGGG